MGIESEIVQIAISAAGLAALAYWVFVAPVRARRTRRAALRTGRSPARGNWDPNTYEGRRNR
jgi:hypothetical protein